MSLITREKKGSKLTIAEMDGNLTYLESNGFVDGEYSQKVIGDGSVIQIHPQEVDDSAEGIYEGISPTGGSGTGLIVDVEVEDTGRGNLAFYTIINGGSGYAVGDTVSIQNADIGGITTGTTDSELTEGDVNVTISSTIIVTNNDITLDTTTLTVTGPINVDGEITTTSNISANQGNFTGEGVYVSDQLVVYNSFFAQTYINFGTLPTTDPTVPGQLWNDSGSLRISTGSLILLP